MHLKKKTRNILMACVIVFLVILCLSYDWDQRNSYKMYNTSTLHYVGGTVTSIESQTLTKDPEDNDHYYGTQDLKVLIKEGDYRGKEIEIVNYLSATSNVLVEKGTNVIVCVDAPENTNPYFTIYNYDRTVSLTAVTGLFAFGMLLVGGMKGLKALAGLVFTMILILFYLVQGIYHGMRVIPLTLFTLLLVVVFALCIMNGVEKKTILFAAATITGLIVAALFCAVCQSMLRVSGYHFSEIESLNLIAQNTGLQVKHLLFAGVLISSMGAVMDVGVSIVSALYEVKRANPLQSRKDIFMAGMNIGKDMIGTMSNTLILAFTGTSLTTMLLLLAFGYQRAQLLNSNYLIMEVVRGISSTFAVIMTVPAASAISAIFIWEQDVMTAAKNSIKR